jgi:hypothetical protein
MHFWNLDLLCRDDACDQTELHYKHRVKHRAEKVASSRSTVAPWLRDAPIALDESITNATSQVYPKPLCVLARDVEQDYGTCCARTVQRRLRRLVEQGHILRLDLGARLYAYMKPGSNMVNADIDLLREQVFAQLAD